jgi:hypothetical protein
VFKDWGDFYFLTGSAAAGLIGLLFVVMTLTSNRDRSTVLAGTSVYTSPVVLHFALVLVLSASALAPALTPRGFSLISGAIALVGFAAAVRVIAGIRSSTMQPTPHWSDVWWYGVGPAVIYLLLLGVSAAIWSGQARAPLGLGVGVLSLLLISIHNAWDLVTWLAPRSVDEG